MARRSQLIAPVPSTSLPAASAILATMAVAALAGLARGFSGFGGALIFVPLASAIVGPQVAAPLLMLVDNLGTWALVPAAWRGAQRREVTILAAGSIVGTPLGAWLLLHLDPIGLRWGMCCLAGLMLALLASGWRYHGRPAWGLSLVVGASSGFCSGAAQMGGPPVVAYWLGGAIPVARARANIVLFFAISGLISAITYVAGGLLNGTVLVLAAINAPIYAVAVWGGSRLFVAASEAHFRSICLLLIGLAALSGLPIWH